MKFLKSFRTKIKHGIIKCGLGPIEQIEILYYLFKLGKWIKKNNCSVILKSRFDLYNYVNNQLLKNTPIDYLEFGVYKGESLNFWSKINKNKNSRFFGFDSFKGLPNHWKGFFSNLPEGEFDTQGEPPTIEDKRVSFIIGFFQDTLKEFLDNFSPQNQLIIHIDADLYSSSLFVLTCLDRYLHPGSIIIFDEFASAHNEFRSFLDYSRAYNKSVEIIAAVNKTYNKVALRISE